MSMADTYFFALSRSVSQPKQAVTAYLGFWMKTLRFFLHTPYLP